MPGITAEAREERERLRVDGLKRCSRCDTVKATDEFNVRSRSWDGLTAFCRVCQASEKATRSARNRARWATEDPRQDSAPKRCSGCKQEFPRTCFRKDRSAEDGLGKYCGDCAARRESVRRDRFRAYWTAPGADPYANPSLKWCGDCEQERPRGDFPTHPSNPDGLNPVCRGCANAKNSAYRARLVGQFVEHVDRDVLWTRDQGICYLCGLAADPKRWDLEHIHPIVHGGEHSYANTAVSHPSCNNSKGGKPWPDVSFDPAL